MSLAKLLMSGKSVIGGKGPIAYRENKRVYLPKFGSQKNPFSSKKESMEPPKVMAEPVPASVSKVIAAKTQKMPAVSVAPVRATTWTEKFNPMSLLRGAKPESPARAVQSELSLEKVKVVHNDLSDVDVEIVPLKSRSIHGIPDSVFQAAVSVDADKNFWSRLDENFFGPNTI